MIRTLALLACCFAVVASDGAGKRPPAGGDKHVAIASQVLVTSSAVADVSSIEAWKRSFIKPGMSDRDKAMAIWRTVVAFRHQDAPPDEFREPMCVHDPITCFNVYGYGLCCCASGNVEELAHAVGLKTRGRSVGHSIPEIEYEGAWHMVDGSLIDWFPKPDGTPASVDELHAAVSAWLATKGAMDDNALNAFQRGGGWRKGPELLSACTLFNENGWLPACTHSWTAMINYYRRADRPEYDYGTAVGYRVNVQLRPGERLTRSWSNRGLHVNQRGGQAPGCLNAHVGAGDMCYSPAYGDLAPGRVGNGRLEWTVPLASATLARVALQCDNLEDAGGGVKVGDGGKPGVLVLRMPTSYVFLSGTAAIGAKPGSGGRIEAELSDDNGLTWKPLATIDGEGERSLALDDLIFRRYDYRLRLTLRGAGTALTKLELLHDVQHSQRALPALDHGSNTVSFSSGDEGTITVFGRTNGSGGKNLTLADYQPVLVKMSPELLRPDGDGSATVPIATPGEMRRIRVGVAFRARDANDAWNLDASFDQGATWKPVGRCAGPTNGGSDSFTVQAPAGARAALVRFAGHQVNTLCLFAVRVDADYVEPASAPVPVKVTYVWDENGSEKRDVHVTKPGKDQWTITCGAKPVMKDLVVELAH